MFATACSTLSGVTPPGGLAALKRLWHAASLATHAATALASELNVASVDVSTPFGLRDTTAPASPVPGCARLPAIRTALIIPTALPAMRRPRTNCANALPVATVV